MLKDHSLFEKPYFVLLESSLLGGETGGRYSIAAWDPVEVITINDLKDDSLWERLRESLEKNKTDSDLPFSRGWIGYLSYEMYSTLEGKVPPRKPDLMPLAVFCRYNQFYLYDHLLKKAFTATGEGGCLEVSRTCSTPGVPQKPESIPPPHSLTSNFTRENYLKTIQTIKNYITAGDCYQVNLSQRFEMPTNADPYTIYENLRAHSPAPYSAFFNLGDTQILSASPESFLEVNGKQVTTRPIKGTRPRGETSEKDKNLKDELERSEKDRAELLMITDLERNDLGRVCKPGTIHVPELRRIESFPQVHHLVATIKGELQNDKDALDLLQATFPGGSITGAPKIRAMQIIHELETNPRNIYCGAIGYLSFNGKAQFNIAIRTILLKDQKAYFWGGGGIVADSVPESEYEETLAKTRGMVEALQ